MTTDKNQKGFAFVATVTMLVALGLLSGVVWSTNHNPRTDDASVRANYVQFAPEVSGRLIHVNVHDNEFVKQGTLLYQIDPRPYQDALDRAISDQALLEEQIVDMRRRINAQTNGVQGARAGVEAARARSITASNSVKAASASVVRAKAALEAAESRRTLAESNLRRIEPLLAKQFVTPEQVDERRNAARVAERSYDEAAAALRQTMAQEAQAKSVQNETVAVIAQTSARAEELVWAMDRVNQLESQRSAKAALADKAKFDLERTTVVATFDGYVTNLNISEGEFAKPGVPIFTMIDNRKWWVMANYRESELGFMHKGSHVDIYIMTNPQKKFDGYVESIGNGVTPDDTRIDQGLVNVEHTLNWVHLAARFPVRIHVPNPDPALFRIGATAITIVR